MSDKLPAKSEPAKNEKTPSAQASGERTSNLRTLVFFGCCLVVSAIASFVVVKFFFASAIPRELEGVWQVMKGPLQGATLEFRADGRAVAVRRNNGKSETTNFSMVTKGKAILLTEKDAKTGKEETLTQTIVEVSENELVLRDEDGNIYFMNRLHK